MVDYKLEVMAGDNNYIEVMNLDIDMHSLGFDNYYLVGSNKAVLYFVYTFEEIVA